MPKFSLTLAVTRSLVGAARKMRKAREQCAENEVGGVKKRTRWYQYRRTMASYALAGALDAYVGHFLVNDECEPIVAVFTKVTVSPRTPDGCIPKLVQTQLMLLNVGDTPPDEATRVNSWGNRESTGIGKSHVRFEFGKHREFRFREHAPGSSLTTTRMYVTRTTENVTLPPARLEDTILSDDESWVRLEPPAVACPISLKDYSYTVPSPLVQWVLHDCNAVLIALFGSDSGLETLPVDMKQKIFLMVRGPLIA